MVFVLKTFESTTDEYRITKLKYAIAITVEGYDQNARLFGKSGTTTGGGDAAFSLTTQSDNSAIEYKRQDIIKSFSSPNLMMSSISCLPVPQGIKFPKITSVFTPVTNSASFFSKPLTPAPR